MTVLVRAVTCTIRQQLGRIGQPFGDPLLLRGFELLNAEPMRQRRRNVRPWMVSSVREAVREAFLASVR